MPAYPVTAVAVIGFAGRLPGSTNAESIWPVLEAGECVIRCIRPEQAEDASWEGIDPRASNWVGVTADIPSAYHFDPGFFGIPRRDAELTDPQHRILLECASEALQHAGVSPPAFGGRIGLYAGATTSRYMFRLLGDARLRDDFGPDQIAFGNNLDYLTTAISYRLGLTGPSMAIQTACSTSLVCVHAAVEALLADECELALAGGVSIRVPQVTGYMFREGGILSPDGCVRPFDARALGTVIGNGSGIVVLQRLEDALAQRSTIWAVVLGSAVNSDGSAKVGFAAPSYAGQRDAVCAALLTASVDPESIGYVEAHGTGTLVGDPIEFAALSDAFKHCGAHRRQYCSIGSIKANIGHLDAAAGVAGLIKLLLMFKHGRLVPLARFEAANPEIRFDESPFTVTRAACSWLRSGASPLRASISSLGIGGTNANVVLEQPPPVSARRLVPGWHILPVSADSPDALDATRRCLADAVAASPDRQPADLVRTLQEGRPERRVRWTAVVDSRQDAVAALRAPLAVAEVRTQAASRLIWAFSGQGASCHPGVAAVLKAEPVAREACESCLEALPRGPRGELAAVLRGEIADRPLCQSSAFALQVALAELWKSWGVQPAAVLGHSLGEYAAAVAAGVFDRETALGLVLERQALMDRMRAGTMLAIHAPVSFVEALLPEDIDLAVRNSPEACVVAGARAAIERFALKLVSIGVPAKTLAMSGAFHSRLMQPAVEPFRTAVARAQRRHPGLPFLSTVTGEWLAADQIVSPDYWAGQLRASVEFAKALSRLDQEGGWTLLEIGMDATLSTFAAEVGVGAVASFGRAGGRDRGPFLLDAAACVWQQGFGVNWAAVRRDPEARRIPLPPTALARTRLLLDWKPAVERRRREPDLERWFHLPVWLAKPLIGQRNGGFDGQKVLLLAPPSELAARIAAEIVAAGGLVHQSSPDGLEPDGGGEADARARMSASFRRAAQRLSGPPTAVIHMLEVGLDHSDASPAAFASVLACLQALAALGNDSPSRVSVITAGADAVVPGDIASPGRGMLSGLCLVARQELANLGVHRIDIPERPSTGDIEVLVSLLRRGVDGPEHGVRHGAAWSLSFEPVSLPTAASPFRAGGTFIILGGLGQFGLAMAAHLLRVPESHVVLVTRRGVQTLSEAADSQSVQRRRKLLKLTALPGSHQVEQADPGDLASLEALFRRVEATRPIKGVIHAAGTVATDAYVALDEMDAAATRVHFGPKVEGLRNLEQVLAGRQLDLCLFTSSLSPFLGGLGLGAYAAAHCFMDRSVARFRGRGIPCQTINWEGWLPQVENAAEGAGRRLADLGLSEGEIASCAERVAAVPDITQAIVATADLRQRRQEWTGSFRTSARTHESEATASEFLDARAALRTIVFDVLGRRDIGDDEDLFQLGANSLTMVQIAARVRTRLAVELRLRTLFETPTIAEIAAALGPFPERSVPLE